MRVIFTISVLQPLPQYLPSLKLVPVGQITISSSSCRPVPLLSKCYLEDMVCACPASHVAVLEDPFGERASQIPLVLVEAYLPDH